MSKKNYAYIDGSFNPKTNVYGYGGFLIDQYGKRHILKNSGNDPEMAKMRNVAGEILGATAAILKAIMLNMDKLTIFYDYEGIAKWALGSWKANKKATKKYQRLVQTVMDSGMKLYFQHVKGHSGIPGNEMADRLAKEAVGIITKKGGNKMK